MQVINIEQRSEEWLALRKGKIAGTTLGEIYSKRGGRKLGFYQVIAERLSLDPDEENRMDRGIRLEEEARKAFEAKTGKKVIEVGLCVSDLNPAIINSPDGLIKNRGKYTEAIEIKCLSPARHLQAVIENKVPVEFESQMMQYFVVNDDLKNLYFVFYDPRVLTVPYHVIEVHRKDVEEKIEFFKTFQVERLAEIDKIVEELSF
jgi:putative phage-type endonuclease